MQIKGLLGDREKAVEEAKRRQEALDSDGDQRKAAE